MNPGKIKLSQLRALVAIADCGNFSEAALDLNLSQSTMRVRLRSWFSSQGCENGVGQEQCSTLCHPTSSGSSIFP